MASIRVKYENGVFVPLEDTSAIENGREFVVHEPTRYTPEEVVQIMHQLQQSRGAWADLDVDWNQLFTEEELDLLDQWQNSNAI